MQKYNFLLETVHFILAHQKIPLDLNQIIIFDPTPSYPDHFGGKNRSGLPPRGDELTNGRSLSRCTNKRFLSAVTPRKFLEII